MAETPEIRGVQGSVTAVGGFSETPTERVWSFSASAVVNYPSDSLDTQTLGISAVYRQAAQLEATSLSITAVTRGRVKAPWALAWTFTLDGHDYYVINLYDETLVYDLSQGQWYSWADASEKIWHLRYGLNWVQTSELAFTQGSNIICGDDTTGALFFLDPDKVTDDSSLGNGLEHPFERVVYGQMPIRGNAAVPCYGVQVYGSLGEVQEPTLTAIDLEFSDDQGNTFVNCGTIDMDAGDYNQRLYWRSLGHMRQPGRLFKLTDFGGLRRLDGIDIDDQDLSTPQ